MTGEQKYSPAAQAVINDYLERVKQRLSGFPPADREDLLREIKCHIDESFAAETAGEEMDRLLRVLRRLGEPADVVSERMSPAMISLGKKKGLPFYILAGTLIALFGVPLGLGAAAVLIGVLAMIFGLLLAYFATALSLLVSGVAGMIVSVIFVLDPGLVDRINSVFGGNSNQQIMISGTAWYVPPQTAAVISLFICAVLTGIGYLMMRGGRHLLRGTGYLIRISWSKITEIFDRNRKASAARQPGRDFAGNTGVSPAGS